MERKGGREREGEKGRERKEGREREGEKEKKRRRRKGGARGREREGEKGRERKGGREREGEKGRENYSANTDTDDDFGITARFELLAARANQSAGYSLLRNHWR